MSVAYMRTDAERQLRERVGVSDTAEVIDVVVRRGDHPRRDVTYRYDVDGRAFTGRARLREKDRPNIARGTPIPIEYLPSGQLDLKGGPTVTFDALFPKPGHYRIWTQFKRGGKVSTVWFTVRATTAG